MSLRGQFIRDNSIFEMLYLWLSRYKVYPYPLYWYLLQWLINMLSWRWHNLKTNFQSSLNILFSPSFLQVSFMNLNLSNKNLNWWKWYGMSIIGWKFDFYSKMKSENVMIYYILINMESIQVRQKLLLES